MAEIMGTGSESSRCLSPFCDSSKAESTKQEGSTTSSDSSFILHPSSFCNWTFLEEWPFRDIYEVLEFSLPAAPVAMQDENLERHWQVPVRLAKSGGAELAELWVLRDNAVATRR